MANERSNRALQRSGAVVDGHNDLPWRLRSEYGADFENFDLAERHEEGHTDIPRLREGRVGGTFFAAYVPPVDPAEHEMETVAGIATESREDHLWRPADDPFPERRARRNTRRRVADHCRSYAPSDRPSRQCPWRHRRTEKTHPA